MRRQFSIAVLLAALLAPAAQADPALPGPLHYLCEREAVVEVIYLNLDGHPGLAVLELEGRLVALQAVPSGSGTLYAVAGDAPGYRWFTKGDEAMLSHVAAADGEEQVLLGACRTAG